MKRLMLKHGVFPDLSVGNTIVIIVTDNCYWAAKEETSDLHYDG